ncbi:Mediator Of Rna polymerase Ii Transcription Subunit 12-Like Protein [Manis pentadactyla]|nr:Mediator Of Rna polymerase Ii Transcription Subunit 12-Like Protein [Manis pentadactyla]
MAFMLPTKRGEQPRVLGGGKAAETRALRHTACGAEPPRGSPVCLRTAFDICRDSEAGLQVELEK